MPDSERQSRARPVGRSTKSQEEHRQQPQASPEQTSTGGDTPRGTKKAASARKKSGSSASPASIEHASSANIAADQIRLKDALGLTYSKSAWAILQAAGDRAIRREGETVASIGLMLILQATVAVGLGMPPRTLSTTRWLVDFALEQGANPEQIASYGSTPRLASPRGEIVLRPAASTAIRMAVALAEATVSRSRFDARHLIIAALDSPDGAVAEQMLKDSAAAGLDLTALRKELIRRTIETPEQGERVEIWRQLLDAPAAAWAQIAPIASAPVLRTSTVSGFASDRTAISSDDLRKKDPLGIDADVTAFARLICLEQATPPLSIGIFGEWGSGKSSFMERLQHRVAKLTEETRTKARESKEAQPAFNGPVPGQGDSNFIQHVVQIRFNAWHYADANLWASLTAEFFDQLRRGGYESQHERNYLGLVGKVADRVRSLEAIAQKATDGVTVAAGAARNADEALAAARAKLAASDLALASDHLGEALKTFQKENAASLKDVGTRIYRTDLSADIDGLKTAVAEAATIPGKVTLIARTLVAGGAPTWLGALSITSFAALGLMWRYSDPTWLAVLLQRVIGWGGGALAAFAALWGAIKTIRPVLDGAWKYAKAAQAVREDLAKTVKKREDEAARAAIALSSAKAVAHDTRAPLDVYGKEAPNAPATILRFFLFEDDNVRDYDKHIGLISRARRSFEQLDSIVAAGRVRTAAREKRANGQALEPAEAAALEDIRHKQVDEVPVPDRIVLYIDDLDRCTHQQVYDVLQAIHLLLAFELFVVVVGVDVRWVEEAVARQFVTSAELPASGRQHEAGPTDLAMERRKRAIEYLEKIFQLPFWLRRLSTEGDKGGSYGEYVQQLLKANLKTAQQSQSRKASGEADQDVSAPNAGPAAPGADDAAGEDALGTARGADDPSALDMALATVELTQAEVDFLASPEIGAIAFKSPRSVKRMLNVYRIVRARMSETELDEFLGRNGKTATWPLAAFFAAVETGQSVEIADLLYDGLKAAPSHEIFTAISFEAVAGDNPRSAMSLIAKADKLAGGALTSGIDSLNARRGSPAVNSDLARCNEALAMARIVRRYSFNRYH